MRCQFIRCDVTTGSEMEYVAPKDMSGYYFPEICLLILAFEKQFWCYPGISVAFVNHRQVKIRLFHVCGVALTPRLIVESDQNPEQIIHDLVNIALNKPKPGELSPE